MALITKNIWPTPLPTGSIHEALLPGHQCGDWFLGEAAAFWADAAELMQTGVNGETRLYVASLSFSNVYYVLRKSTNAATARSALMRFEKLATTLAVDAQTIRQALTSSFADFEDSIQHFAAVLEPAISAIITRNPKDFQSSRLPILSPAQTLLDL